MELEKWLTRHNIEETVMKNLKSYLCTYKEEDEEDFNELFKDMDFAEIRYIFHSVSYVINKWHMGDSEERKYISAKVRLEYDNCTFAEYEGIYDLDGNVEDDYLRAV